MANWEAFRIAVDTSGTGWPQEFAVQSQVYVTDSEDDARSQLQNALWHLRQVNALRNNRQRVVNGLTIEEPLQDEPDPLVMYDQWLLFGTPEVVARKLERLLERTGITYLNCVFAIGRLPHEKVLRSMDLFAREVMPHFRDRVGQAAPVPGAQRV